MKGDRMKATMELIAQLVGIVSVVVAQLQLGRLALALNDAGKADSGGFIAVVIAMAFIALSGRFGVRWFRAATDLAGSGARAVVAWRSPPQVPTAPPEYYPPPEREPEIPLDSPIDLDEPGPPVPPARRLPDRRGPR